MNMTGSIYMLCGTDISFFGVNSKRNFVNCYLIVINSNIILLNFIEITFSFLAVLN